MRIVKRFLGWGVNLLLLGAILALLTIFIIPRGNSGDWLGPIVREWALDFLAGDPPSESQLGPGTVAKVIPVLQMTPTPQIYVQPAQIVGAIKQVAYLVTAQTTLSDFVKIQRNTEGWFSFFNKQEVDVYTQGVVVVGLDLKKIDETDIQVDGRIVTIRMPAVDIIELPTIKENSIQAEWETGLFVDQDTNMVTQAMWLAKAEMQRKVRESDVMQIAQRQAEDVIRNLLAPMGVQVKFIYEEGQK